MPRRLIVAFCLVVLICVGIGLYFFRTIIFPNTSSSKIPLNSEQWMNLISSNCMEIQTFTTNQTGVDYASNLFLALGGDVLYDPVKNIFVSASQKRFAIMPIDATDKLSVSERPVVLFPTHRNQIPLCWAVLIEDAQGMGRMAYETQDGEIKVLEVKNLPAFSP